MENCECAVGERKRSWNAIQIQLMFDIDSPLDT